jgi:hypothetical protein
VAGGEALDPGSWSPLPEKTLMCANCGREVTDAVAELEGWRFHTYGGELVPFCPDCAEDEGEET